jgi:hypothetical protein
MARDVAIMFDELRAMADRLPSCTPTGAAPGGCGPADYRAGTGAAAVVAAVPVSETSRLYVGEPEPIPKVEALAAAEAMARSRRKGSARMFRLSWPVWHAR